MWFLQFISDMCMSMMCHRHRLYPLYNKILNIENLPHQFFLVFYSELKEGLEMVVKTVVTLYVVSQFLKVLPTNFKEK